MPAPLISLKNVTKKFGQHTVLKDITANLDQGEIFGIIGVSGGGKTTLLNLLIGFYRQSGGEIVFNNKRLWKNIDLVQKIFGFARQEGSFYRSLTVEENLSFFGRMYNMPKKKIEDRTNELLDLMGLKDARKKIAESLSTGMQRRLDISCAIIHQPAILILDEPTEDLDPILRKEMLALIRRINKEEETTIIITSHLLGEIEEICTRIAILHEGRIIETGTPLQLKDAYSQNQEVHLALKSGNYQKILKKLGRDDDISSIITHEKKIVIYTEQGERMLKKVLAAVNSLDEEIIEVSLAKPTLEEVFEALTQRVRSMK